MHRRGALWLLLLPLAGLGCDPTPTGLTDVTFNVTSPVQGQDLVATPVGDVRTSPDHEIGYRWVWELDGEPHKCIDDFEWKCPDLDVSCSKSSGDTYDSDMSDAEKDALGDAISGAQTMKGQAWRVTVRPVDRHRRDEADDNEARCDMGPETSRSVTVRNTPPTATVSILPEDPKSHDSLIATATGEDADGDTVRFNYVWTRKGSGTSTEFEGASLSAEETRSDEVWLVTAVPYDTEDGEAATAEVTIGNAKPEVTAISLSPSEPTTLDDLTVTAAFSDEEDDPMTVTVLWNLVETDSLGEVRTELFTEVLDAEVTQDTGISGTESWEAHLSSELFSKEQTIEVVLTANDGEDSDPRVLSVVTVNSPPELIEPGDGSPTVDLSDPIDRLDKPTCTYDPALWSDADPGDLEDPNYRVTWKVTGSSGGTYADEDFDTNQYIFGNVITCTVEPFDGTSYGVGVESESVAVGNSPPLVTVTLTGTEDGTTSTGLVPRSDQDVFASVTATDLDGHTVASILYSWMVNGTAMTVSDRSSPALDLSLAGYVRGDTVTVEVTAEDTAKGVTMVSVTEFIHNSPPEISSSGVSPATLYADSEASLNILAEDADGDSYTADYAWVVGSSSFTGATLSGAFTRDDVVQVTVFLDDGYTVSSLSGHGSTSTPVVHGPITVQDSPPVVPAVQLTPVSPIVGLHGANCTFSNSELPSDVDGDTLSTAWELTHSRTVSGAISALTVATAAGTIGPSIAAGDLEAGDQIRCVATTTGNGLDTESSDDDEVLPDSTTYVLTAADFTVATSASDECSDGDRFRYSNESVYFSWTDLYPDDGSHIPASVSVEFNWFSDCEDNNAVADYDRTIDFNGSAGTEAIGETSNCTCNGPGVVSDTVNYPNSFVVSNWSLLTASYIEGGNNTLQVDLDQEGMITTPDFSDEGEQAFGVVRVDY